MLKLKYKKLCNRWSNCVSQTNPENWAKSTCWYWLNRWLSSLIVGVACLHLNQCFPDYPQDSPQVKSPWSESMSQLMRKLDQLNLDIEEALSASSSPSNTPCTTRKKQVRLRSHSLASWLLSLKLTWEFCPSYFGINTELTVCTLPYKAACGLQHFNFHIQCELVT